MTSKKEELDGLKKDPVNDRVDGMLN